MGIAQHYAWHLDLHAGLTINDIVVPRATASSSTSATGCTGRKTPEACTGSAPSRAAWRCSMSMRLVKLMVKKLGRLNGTARFQGPAAGKYVTRKLDMRIPPTIGKFTATAELLANFDYQVSVADGGMINGTVTGFMENGVSLGNWSVTLNGAADNIGDDDASLTGSFMGDTMATIGGGTADGRWSGTFYGNERKDGRPDAVAGMFDAIAGHAAISGAFGAYNTKAE